MKNRVSDASIPADQCSSGVRYVRIALLSTLMFVFATISLSTHAAAEPVAVQIKSVTIPGISEKGYRGRTAVTPYVVVQSEDVLERFCGRWPRVIDAILIAFENAPVDLKDKAADLASRQDELGRHIEEAVGISVFQNLYLVAGAKRPGAGTEKKSSRFATRQCQPIEYLPWEKEMPEPIRQAAKSIVSSQQSAPPTTSEETESTSGIDAGEPVREIPAKPFPAAPVREKGPSWVVIAIALAAMSGITIIVGSYIGYQVAKIRRDRRRKDRRMKKKDRRSGLERRLAEGPLPDEGDRRSGQDRRTGKDRRDELDRRAKRDRRDVEAENSRSEPNP